jgi:hypothetical protein
MFGYQKGTAPDQLCTKHKMGDGVHVVDGTSSVPKS